eukprot:scaffold61307_cov32-Tisochrysis_lutea.AAC.2
MQRTCVPGTWHIGPRFMRRTEPGDCVTSVEAEIADPEAFFKHRLRARNCLHKYGYVFWDFPSP